MKRHLVFILVCVLAWTNVLAETSIFASADFFTAGDMSSPQITLTKPVAGQTVDKFTPISHKSGFSIGVAKSIIPRLSVGVQYSYNTATANADTDITFNWVLSSNINNNTRLSDGLKNKWENHIVMAFAKFDWFSAGRLSLYSRLGGGVRFSKSNVDMNPGYSHDVAYTTQKMSKSHFAYQVTPLGVNFKLFPFVSLFAEGGYGTAGCLSVGIKAGF